MRSRCCALYASRFGPLARHRRTRSASVLDTGRFAPLALLDTVSTTTFSTSTTTLEFALEATREEPAQTCRHSTTEQNRHLGGVTGAAPVLRQESWMGRRQTPVGGVAVRLRSIVLDLLLACWMTGDLIRDTNASV